MDKLLSRASQWREKHQRPSTTPPPIPYASKPHSIPSASKPLAPPSPSARTPYYHPDLTTGPVTAHFRHELGAHGWGNAESQLYTASGENSFLSAGGLVLRAVSRPSAPGEQRYTSARLTSHQLLARDRGALHVRVSAPVARGVWPAVWLLPRDPFSWPGDGEVDVFETWDGDGTNHSCLHWGHFNGADWDKHRVVETALPREAGQGGAGVEMEFVWDERGRVVWRVAGRAVMKASMPRGARMLRDFRIIINIAMGGNVCKGHLPEEGVYEMVVSELGMWDAPTNGWEGFERDWRETREGHP